MDFNDAPLDPTSVANLSEQSLRLDLVDTTDRERFAAWSNVVGRGFYGARLEEKELDFVLNSSSYRRATGVWDAETSDLDPVATLSAWTTPMSVPGGTVPTWAISAVTVAPTHRRRGIARNLLQNELRTASACGVPVAALTASEATIYGRYGFAPSARVAKLTIDTRRARWSGPVAPGRVRFIELSELDTVGRELYERSRLRTPGEIALDDETWTDIVGREFGKDDKAKDVRAVLYSDAAGTPQGFATYRVKDSEADEPLTATVLYLAAATDEAYAGLWRFILELDLVRRVVADLRSTDEPVLWQVSDVRGVKVEPYDHLWLRIIDPVAALEARTYSRAGRFVLDVADALEFAEGRWLLEVDDAGAATVTRVTGDAPEDAAHVALTEVDLALVYLGGASVTSLHRAGRVTEHTDGAAALLDATLHSPVAPRLSLWF